MCTQPWLGSILSTTYPDNSGTYSFHRTQELEAGASEVLGLGAGKGWKPLLSFGEDLSCGIWVCYHKALGLRDTKAWAGNH